MPYADNDGTRIWYEVGGSGAPLLLHSGFVGCLEDWDEAGYVSALKDQYRLIRPDPRGQSRSDMPHDPSAYAIRHRVGDVLAVLAAEGVDRAHFRGYPKGSGVGLASGRTAPHRLQSLVLGAPSPFQESVGPGQADSMLDDLRTGMAALVSKWGIDPEFLVIRRGASQVITGATAQSQSRLSTPCAARPRWKRPVPPAVGL